MNHTLTHSGRRGAIAAIAVLAVAAIGFAGCTEASEPASTAAERAPSAVALTDYAAVEIATRDAANAVVAADDADAVLAAWPALETAVAADEAALADLTAAASGACRDALDQYAEVEADEHAALTAIKSAADQRDAGALADAVTAYRTLTDSPEVTNADAALESACGLTVSQSP